MKQAQSKTTSYFQFFDEKRTQDSEHICSVVNCQSYKKSTHLTFNFEPYKHRSVTDVNHHGCARFTYYTITLFSSPCSPFRDSLRWHTVSDQFFLPSHKIMWYPCLHHKNKIHKLLYGETILLDYQMNQKLADAKASITRN